MQSDRKEYPVKSFLNNLFFIEKSYCREIAKLISTIVIILIKSIEPLLNIFIIKFILDSLNQPLEITLKFIIFAFSISLGLKILLILLEGQEEIYIEQFKSLLFKKLQQKITALDFELMENKKMRQQMQKAMEIFMPTQAKFMDIKNAVVGFRLFVSAVLQFSLISVILVRLNIVVYLIFICICVINISVNYYASSREFRIWDETLVETGRTLNYFKDMATSKSYAKEVRINNMAVFIKHKIENTANEIISSIKSLLLKYTFFYIGTNTLVLLLEAFLTLYLIYLFSASVITVGEFTLYLSVVTLGIAVLYEIATNIVILIKSALYIGAYTEIINFKMEPEIPCSIDYSGTFDFKIEDVWFKYPNDDSYTLKGVNMRIRNGQNIAVVGNNGAGKSTLINLILGLYQPTKGKIYFNGVDIKKLDKKDYYKYISAVFQEADVFNYSIKENISFNHPGDISMAILKSGFNKLMDCLPEGEETLIGNQFNKTGLELSGGGNQRLMLARTLYRDFEFVVLDEPTAKLSPKEEYEIYTNFKEIVKGKTSLFISHKMYSCKFCSYIYVMNDGKICESGNHDTLMKLKGLYYKMFNNQMEIYGLN